MQVVLLIMREIWWNSVEEIGVNMTDCYFSQYDVFIEMLVVSKNMKLWEQQ